MKKKIIVIFSCFTFVVATILSIVLMLENKNKNKAVDRLDSEVISALREQYPDYSKEYQEWLDHSGSYLISPEKLGFEELFESDGDHLAIVVATIRGEHESQEKEIYAVEGAELEENKTERFRETITECEVPIHIEEIIFSSLPIEETDFAVFCNQQLFPAVSELQPDKKFVLCMGLYSNRAEYGLSMPLTYYLHDNQYLIPIVSDVNGRNIEGMSLKAFRDKIQKIIEGME